MTNIVFFTEPLWAFGTIHYSLCKLLYSYGINAEVLNFFNQYSFDEMNCISQNTDYFVTTPVGVEWLLKYNIPPEKIKSVAHAQWDILLSKNNIGLSVYHNLAGFGVVSQTLKEKSKEFGIERNSDVIPLGIEFDRFYTKPSDKLTDIGFAGAFESLNFSGIEIKRGRLIRDCCIELNIPMLIPHKKMHYLGMPSFYKSVSSIAVASLEEGAGLPVMEGAAAGKLILSTAVGNFRENGPLGGGITLSIEESNYKKELKENILMYSKDNSLYQKKCLEIQEFARENYDWSKHIEKWVEFLQ